MAPQYDAIVGGGSIAGLGFAVEASRRGLSVLVAEEHDSLGEPEKCDGLVSLKGLRRHGFPPDKKVIQSQITKGTIHSPGGTSLTVEAASLEVVVLSRCDLDRQVAAQAASAGAEIRTGARVTGFREEPTGVLVNVGGETLKSEYYVDATGPASSPRNGIILAAKYEIAADWVREGEVEIFLDAARYPGFFAWIIPYGRGLAKVGAAGRGINAPKALEAFLSGREHTVLRKVVAPIYIGGPAKLFSSGRRLLVGESAGMVKPTTAGGIVTSLAGGRIAARYLADAIERKDPALLRGYQREWDAEFGKEMRTMGRLRSLFEQMSNRELDSLVEALSAPRVVARLSRSDFDFHASGLLTALGVRGVVQLARIVATVEARSLLVS